MDHVLRNLWWPVAAAIVVAGLGAVIGQLGFVVAVAGVSLGVYVGKLLHEEHYSFVAASLVVAAFSVVGFAGALAITASTAQAQTWSTDNTEYTKEDAENYRDAVREEQAEHEAGEQAARERFQPTAEACAVGSGVGAFVGRSPYSLAAGCPAGVAYHHLMP